MNVDSGYTEVNDAKLYYEIAGKGESIVLIHGFTLDTRMWDDQFYEFSSNYKVLRYDLRGYGKSATPSNEEYTDADDLMSLMKRLGIEHAYIIGLSMGGSIAIDFTLAYPKAVDALITVDTTLNGYTWTEEYGASLRSIWTTCKEEGLQAAKTQWLDFEIFCPASENPEVAACLKKIVDDYSGIHWLCDVPSSRVKSIDPPVSQRLMEIQAPTLVIVGARDSPDFHIIADLLVQDVPQVRKVVIPGVWHMSNMEAPEKFNEVVLSFLSEINACS